MKAKLSIVALSFLFLAFVSCGNKNTSTETASTECCEKAAKTECCDQASVKCSEEQKATCCDSTKVCPQEEIVAVIEE